MNNKSGSELKCFQCNKQFEGAGGLAFNIGFGPVYYCLECKPPQSVEDTMKSIDEFIDAVDNPPKGNEP